MVEVSYLAAFVGGLLSLLSPCSALLLPAFFAYAFQSRRKLLAKTAVFYVGLVTTLVPLGMGVSAVSKLVYGERGILILVSGLVIVFFGLLQILGRGFEFGSLFHLGGKVRGTSAGATFALGAVYGFAGFCSGPILGAVLTVAASSGEVLRGAALLAAYALGMAAPLFLMAALWERFDLGHRPWLRGREVSMGRLRIHSTSLISGVMFILLGVVFIAYQGTSALSGVYEAYGAANLAYASEVWASSFAKSVPDGLVLAAAVALALGIIAYRRWRRSCNFTNSNDGAEKVTKRRRSSQAGR